MGIKTLIDYCDSTCNLMMGCDGCELFPAHCYAYAMSRRYAGKKGWPKDFQKPELFLDRLDEALRWKDLTGTERPDKPWLNGMPRIIFLNDLGDCFTESIEDMIWLREAVAVMGLSPHIYLLLTKRPRRLAEFTKCWEWEYERKFPANVWGGTSITASENFGRVAELSNANLAVRFLSLEPLLGPLSIGGGEELTYCHYAGQVIYGECEHGMGCRERHWLDYIDWVIAGGENGPGARQADPQWFRKIRDQCQAYNTPFFFKGYRGNTQLDGREWRGMPGIVI